ncbi:MAG TPA: hypothetical protein VHK70_00820 [Burkholderiaceae bacterium]|nr:hypothetical protein [Burkholderiaceae bacterium]
MTTLAIKASAMLLLFAIFGNGIASTATSSSQFSDRSHLKPLTVKELKAIYLECDRAAATTLLDFTSAVECSMISEELLERGFGGNFDRMLEWWRSARNFREEGGTGSDRKTR